VKQRSEVVIYCNGNIGRYPLFVRRGCVIVQRWTDVLRSRSEIRKTKACGSSGIPWKLEVI
jgi:hypothetical protein